jgi:nucleotide-binding universal stress UspA family protein
MWKSIFVPLDGSAFGEHALPLAMSIAKRTGASLKLIHVHAPLKAIYLEGAAFLDESVDSDIKAHQQAYLDLAAERVKSVLSTPVTTQLLVGELSASISEAVVNQGADLVVMTTHGRGPMGRFWLGSVADELVRQIPVPLLLVRPGETATDLNREPEIRHILIALDGSEWAEKILGSAVDLGSLWQADYTLVRIIKPVMPVDAPIEVPSVAQAVQAVMQRMDGIQDQLNAQAQKYLEGVAERLRGQGLKVRTKVDVSEQASAAILEEIDSVPADLVAIETHGRSGLSRLFLGGTADKVVRSSHVPVLLHRPA